MNKLNSGRIKREEINILDEKKIKIFFEDDWSEWEDLDEEKLKKRLTDLSKPGIYEQSIVFTINDSLNNEQKVRIVLYLGKAGGFRVYFRNSKGVFLKRKDLKALKKEYENKKGKEPEIENEYGVEEDELEQTEGLTIDEYEVENPDNYSPYYIPLKSNLKARFYSYLKGSHLKKYHEQFKKYGFKIQIRYRTVILNPDINNPESDMYGLDNVKAEEKKFLFLFDYPLNKSGNGNRRIDDLNKLLEKYNFEDKIGECIIEEIRNIKKKIKEVEKIENEDNKELLKIVDDINSKIDNKIENLNELKYQLETIISKVNNLKVDEDEKEIIKISLGNDMKRTEKKETKLLDKKEKNNKTLETPEPIRTFQNKKGVVIYVYELDGKVVYLDSENYIVNEKGEGERRKNGKPQF